MMNRRQLNQAAALTLGAAASGSIWAQAATAQAPASFRAGRDYLIVNPKAPTQAPAGKIEVVEFFWYNCPHCHSFEPILSQWVAQAPDYIAFRKVPVAFNASFVPQQKMFYALETMGLLNQLHSKIFDAIHHKHERLDSESQITSWLKKQGVDTAKFSAQYNSFAVSTKATAATKLQDAYRVDGVPALGVNGQYFTSGSQAQGLQRALQVVSALAAQANKR